MPFVVTILSLEAYDKRIGIEIVDLTIAISAIGIVIRKVIDKNSLLGSTIILIDTHTDWIRVLPRVDDVCDSLI